MLKRVQRLAVWISVLRIALISGSVIVPPQKAFCGQGGRLRQPPRVRFECRPRGQHSQILPSTILRALQSTTTRDGSVTEAVRTGDIRFSGRCVSEKRNPAARLPRRTLAPSSTRHLPQRPGLHPLRPIQTSHFLLPLWSSDSIRVRRNRYWCSSCFTSCFISRVIAPDFCNRLAMAYPSVGRGAMIDMYKWLLNFTKFGEALSRFGNFSKLWTAKYSSVLIATHRASSFSGIATIFCFFFTISS